MQGTVKGGRRQGRQRKRWEDIIREWTGLEFGKSQRALENRENWLQNHLWCPNDPRGQGIDEDDDDNDVCVCVCVWFCACVCACMCVSVCVCVYVCVCVCVNLKKTTTLSSWLVGEIIVFILNIPEGRPGMSDVSPLSGISGLSFDSTLLSPLLFFCLVLLLFLSYRFLPAGPFF